MAEGLGKTWGRARGRKSDAIMKPIQPGPRAAHAHGAPTAAQALCFPRILSGAGHYEIRTVQMENVGLREVE